MEIRCLLLAIIIKMTFILFEVNAKVPIKNPRLLIISLDGFRHKYLKEHSFPAIKRIQDEGVQAVNGMQPAFATLTFPNHITIATGMYEEEHGVIHNRFFDTKLNKTITFDTRDDDLWSDSKTEPIWITSTKQNKKTAVLFWPAASNAVHNIRPLIYSWTYTDHVSFREKIDNVISYFLQTPIEFAMIYHFEPDKQGHAYGPDTNETYQALRRIDNDLGYLLTRVKKELHGDLNIIILSDHGMTNIVKVIQPFREGYINTSAVQDYALDGALFSVTPLAGHFDEVMEGLGRIPNVTVYKRNEFPEKYHYAKAIHRVGEIIVLPKIEGTLFSKSLKPYTPSKGNHGFDNTLESMQAIFMAWGPNFNKHTKISTLKNVDIYHIACKILGIKPNPRATAGSLKSLTSIFRHKMSIKTNACSKSFIDVTVVLFVTVLYLISEF